jgi:aflatoxin B1 aldehyde reductase
MRTTLHPLQWPRLRPPVPRRRLASAAAAPTTLRPRVILGTMTFGVNERTSAAESAAIFREFARAHADGGAARLSSSPLLPHAAPLELDTARMYDWGAVERVVGGIVGQVERGSFRISTKVNAFPDYDKSLAPASVAAQFAASLAALGTGYVDTLYLHGPDAAVPVESTLEAVQQLYEAGGFRALGLSNYSAWEVVHIARHCERAGFVAPSVYQGMYNAVTRDVCRELLPALRSLGLPFHAYNPLAGGIIAAAKYADLADAPEPGSRFDGAGQFRDRYRQRYWTPAMFQAVSRIRAACDAAGVAGADAAFRWLMHHSQLSGAEGDAVLLGASSVQQLRANLASCAAGPLPPAVVAAYDAVWADHFAPRVSGLPAGWWGGGGAVGR